MSGSVWRSYNTCPHGEYNSKGCLYCRRVAKTLREGQMRACSDCEAYAPLSRMTTKADGRVICSDCQTKLDRLAAEKAQPDLFVEQKGLF